MFTPSWLVNDMLDLVKPETEKIETTFLEPSCGTGNFLIEILRRKLLAVKDNWDVIRAVSSVYGIDIAKDNVDEAKARLLVLIRDMQPAISSAEPVVKRLLAQNIVVGDFINGAENIVFYQYDLREAGKIKQYPFILADLLDGAQRDIFMPSAKTSHVGCIPCT